MRRRSHNGMLAASIRQLSMQSARLLRSRPRLTLLGIGLLLIGLGLGVFLDDSKTASKSPQAVLEHGQNLTLPIDNNASAPVNLPILPSDSPVVEAIRVEQAAEPLTDQRNWQAVTISSGDNLGAIFKQRALSASLVHKIINLNDDTKRLTRLNVGEIIEIDYDDNGQFSALRRSNTEQDWLIIEQTGEQLSSHLVARAITSREREAKGVITGNLFTSGKQAGLRDALIMQLARIFGWDIDFALDIRRGDRFVVIYEEIWRDGEYLRDGEIVATSFVNRGDTFQALRFDAGNGTDYYAADGRPMRKAFLRTPLDFALVTSNFNPRRMHPVLKRVRPHNGVDYRAPTGTPVYATGDGTVIDSAYSNPNGNYVFIRHTNDIVTKYLHFSRRAVNKGQRVKQGQTIGYSGSTGLASAPHLHYEFVVGGVHRNPRTVDLPEAISLSAEQAQKLLAQHQNTLAVLAELDAGQQAMASSIAAGQ